LGGWRHRIKKGGGGGELRQERKNRRVEEGGSIVNQKKSAPVKISNEKATHPVRKGGKKGLEVFSASSGRRGNLENGGEKA